MSPESFISFAPWDRTVANAIKPAAPIAFFLMVATVLFFGWLSWRWKNQPEMLLLTLAYIWLP